MSEGTRRTTDDLWRRITDDRPHPGSPRSGPLPASIRQGAGLSGAGAWGRWW